MTVTPVANEANPLRNSWEVNGAIDYELLAYRSNSGSRNRHQDFILFGFDAFKAILIVSLGEKACSLVKVVPASVCSKVHYLLRGGARINQAHIAHRHAEFG